ncbi:glutathione S-transferase C-terminal domain-containing protein [Tropicimonas sp. S265A]|uniref:glutathione S-transferase C-terminal domain-containing protein n=1 Tax=Tropicimonas sp. S265A TaxID=3415134 RepID=UPI003C7DF3A3
MSDAIDFFFWPTPNGWEVSIALEEMGLPYAKDRYRAEVARLYGVLDRQLARSEYVAGDVFSIADMAVWPWASLWEGQQQTLDDKPHMKRWLAECGARPGVIAGRALHAEKRSDLRKDKGAHGQLFRTKT